MVELVLSGAVASVMCWAQVGGIPGASEAAGQDVIHAGAEGVPAAEAEDDSSGGGFAVRHFAQAALGAYLA